VDEVSTTLWTPARTHASRTFRVPSTAGFTSASSVPLAKKKGEAVCIHTSHEAIAASNAPGVSRSTPSKITSRSEPGSALRYAAFSLLRTVAWTMKPCSRSSLAHQEPRKPDAPVRQTFCGIGERQGRILANASKCSKCTASTQHTGTTRARTGASHGSHEKKKKNFRI